MMCGFSPFSTQVECSPELPQRKLTKFCKDRDIVITSYRPLGKANAAIKHPPYLFDEKIQAIGDKYKKSAAQIILRYLVNTILRYFKHYLLN